MLTLISRFFWLFSRVAPKTAGKLAFKLFCTTVKPSTRSEKLRAQLAKANAVFDQATVHHVKYAGGSIVAYEFLPDATIEATLTTVGILHGWQSNAHMMWKFINPMLEQGWRVVVIDLPGHGQSSGRVFHIPLGVTGLHAIVDELGEFDMMLTHSLGGPVAATAIAGTLPAYDALPVSKLVTISSPNVIAKVFAGFYEQFHLTKGSQQVFEDKVLALAGRPLDEFVVSKQLSNIAVEHLVIHASDDKEIPFDGAKAIADAKASTQLHDAVGLGHRRIIASDDIVDLAVEFLNKQ